MRRDVRAVRSLRVVGRSESRRSNETADAREKEREAGSERRARQSVQDTTFFFFPPSLFGTIESKTLSLFCVVVLTKALVSSPRRRRRRSGSFIGILSSYIHHRTVFLLQNREQQHQARKSKGVKFSRREKHTHRESGFKNAIPKQSRSRFRVGRTFRIRLRPEIGEGESSSRRRAPAAAVYKSVVVSSQRRHL